MSPSASASSEDLAAAIPARFGQFAARLRERNLSVGPYEVMKAMEALDSLQLRGPSSLYWSLRLAMLRRPADIAAFDEAFAEFWNLPVPATPVSALGAERTKAGAEAKSEGEEESAGSPALAPPTGMGAAADGQEQDEDGEPDELRGAYSAFEVLRQKEFADYVPEDYARLREMLDELRLAGPWRLSRRRTRAHRGDMDIRRTVRASLATHGHPVRRRYRARQRTQRRLIFVCDVSGSMESHSYALLHLAHAWVLAQRRVEIFAFATRLTRITPELIPEEGAIRAAIESVVDWSGGTRLGECIAELNRSHRRAVQGAVVVIASDGWDLGDPELLAQEAALVHRIAHRVIWINPHLHIREFEPLTRGMSTMLPHLDAFLPCHNFQSLEGLIELLAEL